MGRVDGSQSEGPRLDPHVGMPKAFNNILDGVGKPYE